jgi:hypothetical protein
VGQVVNEMQWEHKTIVAIAERQVYDEFIKSGSAGKKRRLHRGLGTTKYKETFWVCWKPSREGNRGRLSIQSGRRIFVDKGSAIGSDVMCDCPHVALDEIYAVSSQQKKDALGEGGMETNDEEKLGNLQDLTSPPDFKMWALHNG